MNCPKIHCPLKIFQKKGSLPKQTASELFYGQEHGKS